MSLLQEIVEKGDGIYKAKYKRDCEQRYFGQYIAVDVETGDGFIAPSAAAAIRNGQSAGKQGALFRTQHRAINVIAPKKPGWAVSEPGFYLPTKSSAGAH